MAKKWLYKMALLSSALFSFNTFALCTGCNEVIASGDWQTKGTIVYQNAGYRVMFSDIKPAYGQITNVVTQLDNIQNQLRIKLKDQIQQAISGKASLRGYSFVMNGPFKFELLGQNDGTVTIRIGGFDIHIAASVEKSWLASGTINLDTNTIWLEGKYDLLTGKINNLHMSSFNANVKVDIDSILDLIPGVNAYVTQPLEANIECEAVKTINTSLNGALASQEYTIFGLNQKIADGVYLYDNRDLGKEVKNALTSIVGGQSISITLNHKPLYLLRSDNAQSVINLNNVELKISDHLFVRFIDNPIISEVKNISASAFGWESQARIDAKKSLIQQNPNVDPNLIQVSCVAMSMGPPAQCTASAPIYYSRQRKPVVVSEFAQAINKDQSAAIAKNQLINNYPDIVVNSINNSCTPPNITPTWQCTAGGNLF